MWARLVAWWVLFAQAVAPDPPATIQVALWLLWLCLVCSAGAFVVR
jgi:hypothetical protein